MSIIFVDASYPQGDIKKHVEKCFEKCYLNVLNTIKILRSLGVRIHPKKSIFRPEQSATYLGFVVNSKMTISLTHEKKEKIYSLFKDMFHKDETTLRQSSNSLGITDQA